MRLAKPEGIPINSRDPAAGWVGFQAVMRAPASFGLGLLSHHRLKNRESTEEDIEA